MTTYPFLPPSRTEPVRNRLGEYGVSFPVGQTAWIDTNDEAHLGEGFIDLASLDVRAGTGEQGKAYWRGAAATSYQVSESEKDILVAAGIMAAP